ncbi:MAG: hypothetical protein GX275_02990 [Clostridiales bacterium]|nr:hypothetical protein [Clostridiales bacterium]
MKKVKRIIELQSELDKYKLGKFCKLSVEGSGILYHVEVNYCPALSSWRNYPSTYATYLLSNCT